MIAVYINIAIIVLFAIGGLVAGVCQFAKDSDESREGDDDGTR